jgi:hypothetical protein
LTRANGAADQSRNAVLQLTTTTGAAFSIYAPPSSKLYTVYNASAHAATIYNSTVIGNTTAAGTGVTIPAGETLTVWTNGTNFRVQNSQLNGNITGNAATATTLQTARTINGTSFNGSANVTVPVNTTQKSDNVAYQIPFVTSVTAGNQSLFTDSTTGITYNPSTNTLTTTLAGNLTSSLVAITGGAINGTTVGATTASTVRGTTITATTGFSGTLTGGVILPSVGGTGTVTVNAPNTNAARTVTMPDATTTLVGTDATQTLTNKTITGGVYAGVIDQTGSQREGVVAVAALEIDCSLGNYFTKTISANSTFTFVNAPSTRAYAFTLELTITSGVPTWPASVVWPNGIAPLPQSGKTSLFVFITDNAGARWRGGALVNYTT